MRWISDGFGSSWYTTKNKVRFSIKIDDETGKFSAWQEEEPNVSCGLGLKRKNPPLFACLCEAKRAVEEYIAAHPNVAHLK